MLSESDSIDRLQARLSEIAQLSLEDLDPTKFYAELLKHVTEGLGAAGGAYWGKAEPDKLTLLCQIGIDQTQHFSDTEKQQQHARLFAEVLSSGKPRFVRADAADIDGKPLNPTDFALVLSPVTVNGTSSAIVEVLQPAPSSPTAEPACLSFVSIACQLVAAHQRGAELRAAAQRKDRWAQRDAFACAVHESLNPTEISYCVANEGRRLLDCDRVSVFLGQGRRCRVEAISGQDVVNRRANSVRLLEELTAKVLATGESLRYPTRNDELPPQIETSLQAYLDESHAKGLVVVPFRDKEGDRDEDGDRRAPATIIGGLVIEQFSGAVDESVMNDSLPALLRHSSTALHNALEHRRVFLLPVWAALGKAAWTVRARRMPKALTAGCCLLVLVGLLSVVPANFTLSARGTLQPERRQNIFARVDGEVAELFVKEGDLVGAGEELARLRSSELDLQFEEINGQLETTRKRLDAIRTSALLSKSRQDTDRAEENRLVGEQEELTLAEISLQRQYDILSHQKASLILQSPLEGQVITWSLEETLAHRPVRRGQVLMTVADLGGPWVLELLLPDRRVGHLMMARHRLGPELAVTFILATSPGEQHKGIITKVAGSTRPDEEHGQSVLVTVAFDEGDLDFLRPGASVNAKIDCGRRPIGYVWLHDLFEFVRSKILFRL